MKIRKRQTRKRQLFRIKKRKNEKMPIRGRAGKRKKEYSGSYAFAPLLKMKLGAPENTAIRDST